MAEENQNDLIPGTDIPDIIDNVINENAVKEQEAGNSTSASISKILKSQNQKKGRIREDPSKEAVRAIGSIVCRICHNAESPEKFISPCSCKGTLAVVHRHCLEHWLSTSGIVCCELCHFQFKTKQTLRYSLIQSLRLWYNHPNNRDVLQTDFLVSFLLTLVYLGLVGISIIAFQYVALNKIVVPILRQWTGFSVFVFMVVISFVYTVHLFLTLKFQLIPWYRWWRSVKNITLILENKINKIKRPATEQQTRRHRYQQEIEIGGLSNGNTSEERPNAINVV